MNTLSVSHLNKSFSLGVFRKPKQILHDVSFQVEHGKTTGFIGVNGSGKTTSLKCVLGFITPDSGEIKFFDKSELSSSVKERIGYLPERPYLYEFLTADQARLLDVVTAHIVPTDDTPGAREAHVVRYIDHSLATFFSDFQKDFSGLLAEFNEFMATFRPDGASFLQLTHSEQIAALRDLERLKPDVFFPLRGMTMEGMFSHPVHGGNYQKIGWRWIGYVDQYSWAPPFGYYDRGRT